MYVQWSAPWEQRWWLPSRAEVCSRAPYFWSQWLAFDSALLWSAPRSIQTALEIRWELHKRKITIHPWKFETAPHSIWPCLGSGDVSRCSKEGRDLTEGEGVSVSVVSMPSPSSRAIDCRSLGTIRLTPAWLGSVPLRWSSNARDLRADWTETVPQRRRVWDYWIG